VVVAKYPPFFKKNLRAETVIFFDFPRVHFVDVFVPLVGIQRGEIPRPVARNGAVSADEP
jgi:hypothetical protein